MDLRLLPGVAGNLKSFLADGVMVESEYKSSLLTAGVGSDWGTTGGSENLFVFIGSGGSGDSIGIFGNVDFKLLFREMTFVEVVP